MDRSFLVFILTMVGLLLFVFYIQLRGLEELSSEGMRGNASLDCDVDGNGNITFEDIESIEDQIGSNASRWDVRDFDGDGKLTLEDSINCRNLCQDCLPSNG